MRELKKKRKGKRKLFVTYNKAVTIKQPNLLANDHLANKVQSCLAQPAPTSFNNSPDVDMIWCIVHITLHPGLRALAEKKKNPYVYKKGENGVHKVHWHTTMLHIQVHKLWAMLTPKSPGANSRITLGRGRLTDSDLTIHPHCNEVYACVLLCTVCQYRQRQVEVSQTQDHAIVND